MANKGQKFLTITCINCKRPFKTLKEWRSLCLYCRVYILTGLTK